MGEIPTFRSGELVDIAIRGVRIVSINTPYDDPASITVGLPNTDDRLTLLVPWNGVTVERVAPAEWPPLPGDLWRDSDGGLWMMQRRVHIGEYGNRTERAMVAADADSYSSSELVERFLERHGPLELVHREPRHGESDG